MYLNVQWDQASLIPLCFQDLIEEIKSELDGDYKELVMALFVSPAEYDAWCNKEAIYVSTWWLILPTDSTLL